MSERALPLGSYLRVTAISVTLNSSRPSHELHVCVRNDRKNAVFKDGKNQTYSWALDPPAYLWPKSTLTVGPRPSRRNVFTKKTPKELIICADDLMANYPQPPGRIWQNGDFKVELEVSWASFVVESIGRQLQIEIPGVYNSPISPEDIKQAVDGLRTVLDGLKPYSDIAGGLVQGLSAVHPITNAVVQALSIPYRLMQNIQKHNESLRDVANVMRDLLSCIADVQYAARIIYLKDTVVSIMEAVLEVSQFMKDYLGKTSLGQFVAAQFPLTLDSFKATLSRLRQDFRDAMVSQLVALQASERDRNYLQIKLEPMASKEGDKCLPNTRKDILDKLVSWINRSHDNGNGSCEHKNILWLKGNAGTGKTAIASTLLSKAEVQEHLLSHVFLKQSDTNLSNPSAIWRTLAFQFADSDPDIQRSLIENLKKAKLVPVRLDIEDQFRRLIAETVQGDGRNSLRKLHIALIDALDEGSQHREWSNFLRSLKHWAGLGSNFRLIVTSRNLVAIEKELRGISDSIDLTTGEQTTLDTKDDLRKYFHTHFAAIQHHSSTPYPNTWPGVDIIESLMALADGLFIWAVTAMTFIRGDPSERLRAVLSGDVGEPAHKGAEADKESNIITLYLLLLRDAFLHGSGRPPAAFHAVVGFIMLAQTSLYREDLGYFLNIRPESIDRILDGLRPVIPTGDPYGRIQGYHQSLSDFFLAPERSNEFAIDRNACSKDFALACLRIMNKELRFNICRIETSHCYNKDIPKNRTDDCIPTRLSYACRFWAEHLNATGVDGASQDTILDGLRTFFREHLLHWLEVLSLIEQVHDAAALLLIAAKWIRASDTEMAKMAVDASRFVTAFYDPITQSAPHIYISALPFAPMESEISKCFLQHFPSRLFVRKGQSSRWAVDLHILRHKASVSSVAFSPDGTRIVSGSYDNMVWVWDADTGQIIGEPLRGHSDSVWSVAFSPNGTKIVSGSGDQTVRLWDAYTGQSIGEPLLGHSDPVWSVTFSPDGTRIVSGSRDQTVRVWDTDTGQSIGEALRGHSDSVGSVAFSLDGTRIVSGSDDQTVRVWDAETGQSIGEPLRDHSDWVRSVAFSPDGTKIVSGSADETVRVWNATTGQIIGEPLRGHSDWVMSVAFPPDGTRIVSGSDDQTVRVWDVDTGQTIGEPLRGHSDWVRSVAFSPDGKRIASGSRDETVWVWDADTGQSIGEPLLGHLDWVTSVACSPDGTKIVSGSRDQTVRVWNAATGQIIGEPLGGHSSSVTSVAFSPDGTRIVSASDDQTVRVWDVNTGQCVGEPLRGHSDWVRSVAFSPDGKRIVSGSRDETVWMWDADTGQSIGEPLRGHSGWVTSVACSPDGTKIASGSRDQTVWVWNAATGQSISGPLCSHSDWVTSVAFSPNGSRIVSGSRDQTVRVWDTATGQSIGAILRGHSDWVRSVAFSPDGTRIISGSADETVRVWDAHTGQNIGEPLRGHSGWIRSVAFSPDGARIVSGSDDQTVRVWNADPSKATGAPPQDFTGQITSINATLSQPTRPLSPYLSSGPRSHAKPSVFLDHLKTGSFSQGSKWINGWVCGPDSEPLFWVPPSNRAGLWWPGNTAVIGVLETRIDFSHFVHGSSWEQCRSK